MPTGLAGIHANPMAGTAIKSGHGALQMMKCSCNPANNRETPEETSPARARSPDPVLRLGIDQHRRRPIDGHAVLQHRRHAIAASVTHPSSFGGGCHGLPSRHGVNGWALLERLACIVSDVLGKRENVNWQNHSR